MKVGIVAKKPDQLNYNARTNTPERIKMLPIISFKLNGSPNITTPRIIAITTLNLSIGATQEAGAN